MRRSIKKLWWAGWKVAWAHFEEVIKIAFVGDLAEVDAEKESQDRLDVARDKAHHVLLLHGLREDNLAASIQNSFDMLKGEALVGHEHKRGREVNDIISATAFECVVIKAFELQLHPLRQAEPMRVMTFQRTTTVFMDAGRRNELFAVLPSSLDVVIVNVDANN